MLLQTTDIIAIIIALAGACTVMVVSIQAHGRLMRENRQLRMELAELEYSKVVNK